MLHRMKGENFSEIFNLAVFRKKQFQRTTMDDEDNLRLEDNQGEKMRPRGQTMLERSSILRGVRWERLPWPGLTTYQAIFVIFSILIRPSLEGIIKTF